MGGGGKVVVGIGAPAGMLVPDEEDPVAPPVIVGLDAVALVAFAFGSTVIVPFGVVIMLVWTVQ